MLWGRQLLFWVLGECQAQRKEFCINSGCARSQDCPGCHQHLECGGQRGVGVLSHRSWWL